LDSIKGFNGIGGKKLGIRFDNWVVDLSVLPIFIAVFLVPSILQESESTKSFTIFSHWLILKIFAWASCLLVWWLSAYLITKNGTRHISVFLIWLIGFLGGVSGCAVGEIFKNWLGLTFSLNFYQRTTYTSLICILIVMVTSVAGRSHRSFIFFKHEIRRSLIKQRIYTIRSSKRYLTYFDTLQNEIMSNLLALIDMKSNKNNIGNLRLQLRGFSHDLSRDLMHHKIRKPKSVRFFYPDFSFKLFLISIRSEPLNPNIFAIVIGFFVGIPMLRVENSLRSLILGLLVILVTFIIHHAQYYYWKIKAQVKFSALIAFDFFNVLIITIALYILKNNYGFYETVSNSKLLLLAIVVMYSFFFILGHISRVGDVARANQLMIREDEIANIPSRAQLVEDEESRLSLAWAKFIHSVLQPYLLTSELAKTPIDSKLLISEVKKKVVEFEKSIVYFGDPHVLSLDDCVKYLYNKWSEILSITVNTESVSKKTKINPQAILDLKDVINELALNAVKHGQADVLRVEVKSRGNNSLVVRAENDGEPLGKIKPGLGSAIFDLLSGESWSLKNYGGMVFFTCRIYSH